MITVNDLICSLSADKDFDCLQDLVKCAIASMDNEGLTSLQNSLPSIIPSDVIDDAIRRNIYREEKEASIRKRNHSIVQLLEWYENKRSHKVMDARKELQNRFLHLTYEEQVMVIRSFVKGCKSDVAWCYNILRYWWSDELLDTIVELWDEQQDERCGWLIARYAPIDIIRERIETLTYDSNYYRLCKRLVKEDWFVIDKERLMKNATSDEQYLWIMSQTKEGLPVKDAFEVLYFRIAIAVNSIRTDIDPHENQYYGLGHVVSKVYIDCGVDDNFYLTHLEGINKMLSSLLWMGYFNEVKAFLTWDKELHAKFMQENSLQFDYIEKNSSSKRESILDLYRKYAEFVAMNFPTDYLYLFDELNEKFKPLGEYIFRSGQGWVRRPPLEMRYINETGRDFSGLPFEELLAYIESVAAENPPF